MDEQTIKTSTNSPEPRGIKRKQPMDNYPPIVRTPIFLLVASIIDDLDSAFEDEELAKCGLACELMLRERPDVVLELARNKLHTWPYHDVPLCWRRLYEEAALECAFSVMRAEMTGLRQAMDRGDDCANRSDEWTEKVIKLLDTAIHLTGAPGQSEVIRRVFKHLEDIVGNQADAGMPNEFSISRPKELQTKYPIIRHVQPLGFESFQAHLDKTNTPMIIAGTVSHWQALREWTSASYWLQRTLGGRRLVPVEIGSQYTDSSWSQKIIPFRDFLTEYMLHNSPKTGYLAQYDLFAQIPALREDVSVPDYCYCSPPQPKAATENGDEEGSDPLMNLWLGPAGTKTPLHTDPYSNILVQVMGYKYVRLYSPAQSAKLYPMSLDDNGVDMSNTASVDVSLMRSQDVTDAARLQEQRAERPLFEQAEYVEAILGPGECLYIPQGWWHYVEGLTIGASVSFWWN